MLQKKENSLLDQITRICLIVVNAIAIIAIITIIVSLCMKNELSADRYASICYYALFVDVILYSFFIFLNKK